MNATTTGLAAVGAVALLVAAATAPATAAHPESALVVEVDSEGDATVTLRSTFDLSTDAERQAFADLRDSRSERAAARQRFRDRMARVAAAAANRTGRSMSVTNATIDLTTTDDNVGIVRVSVDWTGLAAVRGDRVVVTTPFADGYDPERPLVIVGPEGYEAVETTPSPAGRDGATLRWGSGADLDGFTVTYAPADGGSDGGGGGDGDGGGSGGAAPGFGFGLALAALLAAVALARRT